MRVSIPKDNPKQSRCNHSPWSATSRTTIHHPDQNATPVLSHRPPPPNTISPHDTESATLGPPPRPPVRDPQTAIHGAATEALESAEAEPIPADIGGEAGYQAASLSKGLTRNPL
ncbi:unnamed protein product [Pleuronectes platessa]|uniref:Uncharacterized protein n=1 Tax=Pleuronectes platessa TaxID=8262 RepID=A0A9N7YIP5_PLEPL|nr:unnamed protein product [Pleuronectes platessa]